MQVYLLDTCIWSYWFNPRAAQHQNVRRHVRTIEHAWLGMSVITRGEIEFGWRWHSDVKAAYCRFIEGKKPAIYKVDRHTAVEYGRLKVNLCRKFPPWGKQGKGPPRLSQLEDPVTSEKLGVDENDLWIAAQAISRGLILVTNDKLARIREAAGRSLRIENWAQ